MRQQFHRAFSCFRKKIRAKNQGTIWVQLLPRYAQLAHLESPAPALSCLFSVWLGFDSHLPPHVFNNLQTLRAVARAAKDFPASISRQVRRLRACGGSNAPHAPLTFARP